MLVRTILITYFFILFEYKRKHHNQTRERVTSSLKVSKSFWSLSRNSIIYYWRWPTDYLRGKGPNCFLNIPAIFLLHLSVPFHRLYPKFYPTPSKPKKKLRNYVEIMLFTNNSKWKKNDKIFSKVTHIPTLYANNISKFNCKETYSFILHNPF